MGLFDFLGAGRREKFADKVAARLAERGWPHRVAYDAKARKIDLGGDNFPFVLEEFLQPFEGDPRKDRAAALDAVLDFVFELPMEAPFERAKSRLFPILRGRTVTEAIRLCPPEDPRMSPGTAYRPFAEHYVVQVASEVPLGFLPLPGPAYERWNLTFDQVLDVAMSNLRARPGLTFKWLDAGFYGSYSDDGNDLARLLLPENFQGIELRGAPVVIGAAREAIFVAGSEDAAGLEAMARYVPYYLEQQRLSIAFRPLILDEETWRPFQAPEKVQALKDLDLLQRAHDYEQERPLGTYRLTQAGRPEDVYPLKLYAAPEGTITLAFWRPSVGLVPQGDYLVVDLGAETVVRGWADVADALGFALEPGMASPHYSATKPLHAAVRAAILGAPEPEWAKGKGYSFSDKGVNVFG